MLCHGNVNLESIFHAFERMDIVFKNEQQVQKVLKFVKDVANNTRLWENNGYTPNELFEKFEKPKLKPFSRDKKKVGRNDLCPCGSGKKYKKCCLNK